MDRASVDQLLATLESATEWPLKRHRKQLEDLYTYAYMREADHDRVKGAAEFDENKRYIVDPLAERISQAFADLIFGEEPDFQAATPGDQDNLEFLINENMLSSELQTAEEVNVSEGEVIWRVVVDKDRSDVPIIEYISRTVAFPLFRGRQMIAVAFINVIEEEDRAWRYVSIHAEGIVVNRLYEVEQSHVDTSRGIGPVIPQSIIPGRPFGTRVPLDRRVETKGLPDEWKHDLPSMLAGRLINRRGRDPRIGRSQYAGVKDLLFSLNEAATIGHANMKLTAKKRAVVDQSVLHRPVGPDGEPLAAPPVFDPYEDVFVAQTLDESLDENKPGPFKVMEYSFDATNLIAWTDHLVDTILTRCRTAPQLVGRHTEQAQSAPALKARLLDSTLAASGMGRQWDDQVPEALRAAAMVDALRSGEGGFGRSWTDRGQERPSMKRKSIIPEDEDQTIQRLSTARGALLMGLKTALQDLHPEWDDDRINEEVDAIRAEEETGVPPPPPGGDQA